MNEKNSLRVSPKTTASGFKISGDAHASSIVASSDEYDIAKGVWACESGEHASRLDFDSTGVNAPYPMPASAGAEK